VDDLHDLIAAYLRGQRPGAEAARESAILAIWRERAGVPRCTVCGATVDDDDNGLYNLEEMQRVRECALHHAPF
jgi:hypothetical protein